MKANVSEIVSGSCGLGILKEFRENSNYYRNIDEEFVHCGGTGFYVAMFVVGDDTCTKAYEILKAKHPIVYESPVRFNVNSGNNVFFCIFDGGEGHGFDAHDEFYGED